MLHLFGAKLVRNEEDIMALHVMDEANHCLGCKNPRCQQGCPIHTNIPEVIRLLKDNKLDEAGRTSVPGIFASGDAVKGARTVVEAVAYDDGN